MKYLDDHRSVALLDAAPDAMVCVTADGRIALVNAQAERLFGYQRADLIGQQVEVLVPDSVRATHPRHRCGYVADPAPRPMGAGMELAGRRQDGSTFPAEISLATIETDEGILVTAAVRDVTGRKRAKDRFLGLLEAAPDAMVCVAADGRIALVNAQVERLFRYPRDELVGQPVEILVPDAARALHPGYRAGYLANPQPRPMGASLDLSACRRDGSTFPVEISLSTIDTDEGILVTAAVRDVTDRLEAQAERERIRSQAERDRAQAQAEHELLKSQAERARLEAQLHQSQRLESLGQLAGGVAHDFNNLLGVISNYAAFVSEEAAKDPPQVQWQAVREDIEQVEKAAQRAAALTRQLLAFARREVVQPRMLSLNDMIADLEQLLLRTLGEHIELVTRLAPDLGPVLADGGQIEQVLVNLAVNARDAMQGGGMLTLETASTHVDEAYATDRANLAPGRYVSLKVSDTGIGIPRDVIERVFEPFFTTKSKGEGSGLGLATVYGIIAQADGTVRIYSEPGLGTTLTVLLPITDQAGHAAQPSRAGIRGRQRGSADRRGRARDAGGDPADAGAQRLPGTVRRDRPGGGGNRGSAAR